jgi:nickel-dependent lactate racemase
MEVATVETQKVRLRVAAWIGERDIELAFPSNWEVTERRMAGHDKPALTDDQMRTALHNPIGTPRLSELARGKEKVVILFDDMSKPTPIGRIVPVVLEELHAGGIEDEQIRFLAASGTHRYMTCMELAAKLGTEIVERYPVYLHNIYENTVFVGNTSNGTPVYVNREFASCDLKVGIGSIIPHNSAGFGGGAKLVLPGIAGIQTVAYHHTHMRAGALAEKAKRGLVDDNPFRLDMEEASRLAGLQFRVDSILNNRREVVGLFAGDFVAEHRAGVKLAREVYATQMLKDMDVLVINCYPDEVQFPKSTWIVPRSLREGGDVVILIHSPSGETGDFLHQLSSRFGTDFGGSAWKPGHMARSLAKAARVIIMAPFLSKADRMEFGPSEKVVRYKSWGEVLADLVSRHGPGTKAGVYPYPSIQLPV